MRRRNCHKKKTFPEAYNAISVGHTEQTAVTEMLTRWRAGDQAALGQLMSAVLPELKRTARRAVSARAGQTLQPTALVNEVYLRLVRAADIPWNDRAHFFAVIGQMMRRVVVDYARGHAAGKRGGGEAAFEFDEQSFAPRMSPRDVVALDDALAALEKFDPRKSRVVELRYFVGLTVEETAEVLGVSPETVLRDWKFARTWLSREILGPSAAQDVS